MIQIITAIEHDGIKVRTLSLGFEVPNKEFDLITAIKAAATDYCKTPEGRDAYDYNCSHFNWADFAMSVPNEFCEKHGFKNLNSDALSDIVVDWDEQLVNGSDLDPDAWLIEQISNDTIANIEDFLGYPVSADVLEGLDDRIREVLTQMPEEEILLYHKKYSTKEEGSDNEN